jgi:hypothetical protein
MNPARKQTCGQVLIPSCASSVTNHVWLMPEKHFPSGCRMKIPMLEICKF